MIFMDENNVWLSVIIPIYNAEKYLFQCLNSISKQTFKDFEVILVDDGSTDTSSNICHSFCSNDKRFRYIKIDNSGSFRARVVGMKEVKSRYFTFCDADDYYVNSSVFQFIYDSISKQSNYVSVAQFGFQKKFNHLKQKVQFVENDCCIDKQTFYLNEYPKLLCGHWEKAHLNLGVWNKVYISDLLVNIPDINERVFWGDDLLINLHLLETVQGALFLKKSLYIYRQISGGTKRFSKHTMEDVDRIKKYQLQFLDKREEDDKDQIRKILFTETAVWFFIYLKEAKQYMDRNELEELISYTLSLPSFKMAKDYFENDPENWRAINLIRKSDAEEYLTELSNESKITIKQRINGYLKEFLKRI